MWKLQFGNAQETQVRKYVPDGSFRAARQSDRLILVLVAGADLGRLCLFESHESPFIAVYLLEQLECLEQALGVVGI